MTGVAWAADAAAPGGMAALSQFVPLILIFIVFYFLLIRPQQKKAKEHQSYLANLKKGDKVVTNGGIFGQIANIAENVVTLEIADNVRIKISRGSIAGSASEAEKAPAKKG
ncbi:preprotein translocase subunit YajC [Desulfobulbus rhabdoformis]|jgi:preprotein translocase subunit YajC|uniref:preprotein translocase subunit YajC n=1 Tax=Desulfobulbus rhabdoformis TaxID=34032 RepID=UPI001964F5C0|nr:preprotein translocase subunit YajC [Desulfobulbus rhabdoformis]MBM9615053.1 preprotein translocase subunit YajC [Desulfobulbus rhabdoformis]